MNRMELLKYDIIIIGSGIAGFKAAIHASQASKDLKIAVISKLHAMRSHSVSAEGGVSAVLYGKERNDSYDLHAYDTIKGSDYLADQDSVEILVKNAPQEIAFFDHIGVPWNRDEKGIVMQRPFGGMTIPRTVFAADETGFFMMRALYDETKSLGNVDIFHEHFVTTLLMKNKEFAGAYAINLADGSEKIFEAKACIIATGGFARIYGFTTTAHSSTGDGTALAYNAGASLKDMEFVQFHPTGLVPNGILITEAARGEGGYLRNAKGRRFMEDYAKAKMELAPRDIISRAIITEIEKGNGIKHGESDMEHVQLDLTHLDPKKLDERLPMVKDIAMKTIGVDPGKEPLPVRPAAHFTMGGINSDNEGRVLDGAEKAMRGLWAAGEAGCVSVHGANRLGSNSLSECAVWGRIAGEEAAKYAKTQRFADEKILSQLISDEEGRLKSILEKSGDVNPYELKEQLNRVMDTYFYVYRSTGKMKKGIAQLAKIKKQFYSVRVEDKGRIYNTNFRDVLELGNMICLADIVAQCAANRKESRGAHAMLEYTKRDDKKWLKHTIAFKSGDSTQLSYSQVRITRWKPQERKY